MKVIAHLITLSVGLALGLALSSSGPSKLFRDVQTTRQSNGVRGGTLDPQSLAQQVAVKPSLPPIATGAYTPPAYRSPQWLAIYHQVSKDYGLLFRFLSLTKPEREDVKKLLVGESFVKQQKEHLTELGYTPDQINAALAAAVQQCDDERSRFSAMNPDIYDALTLYEHNNASAQYAESIIDHVFSETGGFDRKHEEALFLALVKQSEQFPINETVIKWSYAGKSKAELQAEMNNLIERNKAIMPLMSGLLKGDQLTAFFDYVDEQATVLDNAVQKGH